MYYCRNYLNRLDVMVGILSGIYCYVQCYIIFNELNNLGKRMIVMGKLVVFIDIFCDLFKGS